MSYRTTGRDAPWRPARVRKRIQAMQLVKRLQDFAFGKCQMTAAQVRSAEILLRKTVPDLSSVELTGDRENPIENNLIVSFCSKDHPK